MNIVIRDVYSAFYVLPVFSFPVISRSHSEILHLHFLDSWTGCVPWRTEEHKVEKLLASDALQSRWGTTLSLPGDVETASDYFSDDLGNKDIAVKEALALLSAL